jgi:hypothetical protein
MLLGILAVLCICALVFTGVVGLYVWRADRTRSLAATAGAQTLQAGAAQATASPASPAYAFFDPFDDNLNSWGVGDIPGSYLTGQTRIENGVYVFTVEKTTLGAVDWSLRDHPADLADFDASVEAKRMYGSPSGVCDGLQFRAPNLRQLSGYYDFGVCDNGFFHVDYYDGEAESWTTLRGWTRSDAIRADEWNKLGVSARGDQFTFTINDQNVAQLNDAHLTSGDVRFYIDMQIGESGTVWFDNFSLLAR